MCYSLYNWIGEHEITKLKKYIYLLRIQILEMSVLARARAQLLKVLYIFTHLSVPHGENI